MFRSTPIVSALLLCIVIASTASAQSTRPPSATQVKLAGLATPPPGRPDLRATLQGPGGKAVVVNNIKFQSAQEAVAHHIGGSAAGASYVTEGDAYGKKAVTETGNLRFLVRGKRIPSSGVLTSEPKSVIVHVDRDGNPTNKVTADPMPIAK